MGTTTAANRGFKEVPNCIFDFNPQKPFSNNYEEIARDKKYSEHYWEFSLKKIKVKQFLSYPKTKRLVEKFFNRAPGLSFMNELLRHKGITFSLFRNLFPRNYGKVNLFCPGTVYTDPFNKEKFIKGITLYKREDESIEVNWITKGLDEEFGPNDRIVLFRRKFIPN